MMKKWFQHSEVMAGAKRLILSFYIYKIFGEFALRVIAFFVTLGAFINEKERRQSSYEYFRILGEYNHKNFPLLISSFKQFLNYGNSLVDKMISFAGNLSVKNFRFIDDDEEIKNLLESNKGIFFITTHIGNVEILRSFLYSDKYPKPSNINIFLEKKSCEIFNNFLENVKTKAENITSYAVEDIEISTAIELSEKLEKGELVFMAGDRIAADNPDKVYNTKLLGKEINLPIGTLKLAQMMDSTIYFIICVKDGKYFNIHTKKFIPNGQNKKENLENLKNEYSDFLEKYVLKYPYQFFHFYKIFQ